MQPLLRSLQVEDIERALEALIPELSDVLTGPHKSRRFDLLWKGHRIPPKVVISKAVALKTGKPFPESNFSGGEASGQANKILRGLGFRIVPKLGTQYKFKPGLPLTLHERYTRKQVYATTGIQFSPQQRHLLRGLSPKCKDDGYFIFITMDKEEFKPAQKYPDEVYSDRFVWVTRRDRGENQPEYVRLREPNCRVSLFVRNNQSEKFLYAGELEYESHRQWEDVASGKRQQKYTWRLKCPLPDELVEELTLGPKKARAKRISEATAKPGRRRSPSSFDEFKKIFGYALDSADRTVIPAHQHYQVRLAKFLREKHLSAQMEKDFIDVMFSISGKEFVGEIKVTTHLTLPQAFRIALGQVLEYANLGRNRPAHMIMLLDQVPDEERLNLASQLSVSVVAEEKGDFVLLNPAAAPEELLRVFPVRT